MFHRKSKSILISITMVMSIVIAILIYIGINIYLNQKASVVIKNNSQSLEKQILNLSNAETTTFERLAVFEWDKVYIYAPYSIDPTKKEAFNSIGDVRGLNTVAPFNKDSNFVIFVLNNHAVAGLFGQKNYQITFDYSKGSPKVLHYGDNTELKIKYLDDKKFVMEVDN